MNFKVFVKTVHVYFGKNLATAVPEETFRHWEKEVGKYPAEFYDWCYQHLRVAGKKVLDNFPVAVEDAWNSWMSRNPNKIEQREFACRQEHCDNGYLHVYKESYLYAFRCGECKALPQSPIPMATLERLLDEGYEPETYDANERRKVECDPVKWRQHFGGRGISGEGYQRLQDALNTVADTLPF